jgi:hypothetical protein
VQRAWCYDVDQQGARFRKTSSCPPKGSSATVAGPPSEDPTCGFYSFASLLCTSSRQDLPFALRANLFSFSAMAGPATCRLWRLWSLVRIRDDDDVFVSPLDSNGSEAKNRSLVLEVLQLRGDGLRLFCIVALHFLILRAAAFLARYGKEAMTITYLGFLSTPTDQRRRIYLWRSSPGGDECIACPGVFAFYEQHRDRQEASPPYIRVTNAALH